MPLRFTLATLGSLGDLHPFLALGAELQQRGHQCAIATHHVYCERIERAGFTFFALRPDYDPSDVGLGGRLMDPWRGTERIVRKALFPYLRQTFDDLAAATRDADVLISHSLVFAAPLVSEKTEIPWISVVLAPLALLSHHDPPHALPEPWMNRLLHSRPYTTSAFLRFLRNRTLAWSQPVFALRAELGLPTGVHPLIEGQHSDLLSLALFSRHFASPQRDWPPSVQATGFLFYDTQRELSPAVERFLDQGSAPVVFTLGTAAVLNPGKFYRHSVEAARSGGFRAVLLAGKNSVPIESSADILVTEYEPFSELLPRCAAVVHQGGIGTTAQTLRAGCPSLVVPFAHDQPDNAARISRLNAGRLVTKGQYNARTAVTELHRLLNEPSYRIAAEQISRAMAAEHGATNAAEAIERAIPAASKRAHPAVM